MKILITGGKGMLGRTLQSRFSAYDVTVADLPDCDILNKASVAGVFAQCDPDIVVHCAAMTDVDGCETSREKALKINEEGARNVAIASAAMDARLIAISTDYVFSGNLDEGKTQWHEQDVPRPQTVYGASKFAGEQMIMSLYPEAVILRTAWLYGEGGPSFVHTIAKRLQEEDETPLKVVNDQYGNPTSADALADIIEFVIGKPSVEGIVHATCSGSATWYDLACEIKRYFAASRCEVLPCTTAECPRAAQRPANSSLENGVLDLLGYKSEPWREALSKFMKKEFPVSV